MSRAHLLVLPLALASCRAASVAGTPMDIHSYAEPDRVRVTHVSLDLDLDFEARRAHGHVRLDLDRSDPRAPLVLDSMGLDITGVQGADGGERSFELGRDARASAPPCASPWPRATPR